MQTRGALIALAIGAFTVRFATLLGAQIHSQFVQLVERAPDLLAMLGQRFGIEDLEGRLVARIQNYLARASLIASVAGISSSVLGAVANLILVVVAGIYFAADPGMYRRGLLMMFPQRARAEAEDALDALGISSRRSSSRRWCGFRPR